MRLEPADQPAIDIMRFAIRIFDSPTVLKNRSICFFVEMTSSFLQSKSCHGSALPIRNIRTVSAPKSDTASSSRKTLPLDEDIFGTVEEPHAKNDHTLREFVFGKYRDMVEELEGEVVGDQVFCREPVIVRVPVQELFPHGIEFLLLGEVWGFFPEEDVVKDFGGEEFWIDFTDFVGDGVIRHVDGRIRERFDELCRVPREPGAKADPPGACPVLEPVHGAVELKPDFRGDQCHISQVVADLLLPCGVAVFQEPLVMQDLDFYLVPAPADDRAGVKLVHDLRVVLFDHESGNFVACNPYGFSAVFFEEFPLENSAE